MHPARAITNGEVDATNKYPNVGAVVIIGGHLPRVVPSVSCSGTLIHSRVFLTAGHCTDPYNQWIAQGLITIDDLRISFGQNALDPGTLRKIDSCISHPGFIPIVEAQGNDPHDVGAIILHDPVTGGTPATLPT